MGNYPKKHVTKQKDGTWAVTKQGAKRASSKHKTQGEAIESARNSLKKTGGQMFVHGENGKIRDEYTYHPKNDPPDSPG